MISMRKKQVPLEERRRRSVAMQDEVATQDAVLACAAAGKNVFLPVVDGDFLRIRRFSGRAALTPGESYAIPEPVEGSEEVRISDIDLVVVPGVAFDMDGGRMGRGKGFYDRLLAGASDCSQGGPYKVGVCFDFQVVDAVPREAHDMLMDAVVCESRTEIIRNDNRVCSVFCIRYPIVSGGMVWCSGWRLASAVSAAGGLGLLGAGSMKPELLREHIAACRAATDRPFGVNVPLMSPYAAELMEVVLSEKVPVVFTSAGNPKTWTPRLKDAGVKVAHVVSSSKFAVKCAEAGVDAVVAEGFEAGGHNGREETATMVMVPQVRAAVSLPLLAAGGIVSGAGMAAAFALGAAALSRAQGGRYDAGPQEGESDPPDQERFLCTGAGCREPRGFEGRARGTARTWPGPSGYLRRRLVSRRVRDRPGCLPHLRPALGCRYRPFDGGRLPSGCGRDGGAVISCSVSRNDIVSHNSLPLLQERMSSTFGRWLRPGSEGSNGKCRSGVF